MNPQKTLLILILGLSCFSMFAFFASAQETFVDEPVIDSPLIEVPDDEEEISLDGDSDVILPIGYARRIKVDKERAEKTPAKYLIQSTTGYTVADSFEFNDSETCIYTDKNIIICGGFTIKQL